MPHNNISQADIVANIDTLEANTDTLETLIASTNTKLDTLDGRVDTLEALLQNTTTTHRLLSAAGTVNATSVKGAAGVVYRIGGHNARASAVYLKLYNKATAPDENDTPRATIYLPAGQSFVFDYPHGLSFATGIGYRMTTAGTDNDTGALTAGDILAFNLDYV